MQIIWFLIIGLLAGWLAGQIMRGRGLGLIGNLVVGVVGSVIGGFLFSLIGFSSFGFIGSLITGYRWGDCAAVDCADGHKKVNGHTETLACNRRLEHIRE